MRQTARNPEDARRFNSSMSLVRVSCVCLALLGGAFGIVLAAGLSTRSARNAQPGLAAGLPSHRPLSPHPSRLQPAECTAAAGAVAELPDDIDLAVVVENGAELRATPLGEAATRFLGDSGVLEDLAKAWSGLADQLGWTRAEAFDRLLGQRVVLVSKSLTPAERRWAVLTDVTLDTEQRLKEKLQAAPRSIVEGHQILTIEGGGYELTSHHRDAPAAPRQGRLARRPAPSDRVTVVLGPSGKSELFDEIISTLSGTYPGAGTLATRDVFKRACGAGPTEVLVLASFEPETAAGERWKDFFILAGHRDDAGPERPSTDAIADAGARSGSAWHSRVVVRQASRTAALMRVEPSSDASFRALSDGSLFAMVQNVGLADVLGEHAPFGTLLSKFPLPDEVKKELTAGQALVVRTTGPDNRVSCTLASRTEQTERVARTLDGPLARWLANLEKQCGVENPRARDYAGVAPNAVRVAPLASTSNGSLAMFTSKPLVVSWAYPSRSPAGDQSEDRPGWWVMNVSQTEPPSASPAPAAPPEKTAVRAPTPAELLRTDASALLDAGISGETARWVWLAAMRPAALEAMLPSIVPDLNGFRSGLRRFESLDLKLRITDDGDIQGDLGLRLSPTATTPPKATEPSTAAKPAN